MAKKLTIEQARQACIDIRKVLLNHFEHGYSKWTITMKSWKEKENKRRKHELA